MTGIIDAQDKYHQAVAALIAAIAREHDPMLAVFVARAINAMEAPELCEATLAEQRRRVAAREKAAAKVERAAYKLAQAVWAGEREGGA